MLKKTVTYEDFNGETVTEDLFFHLSPAELVKLEVSHDGGLSAALQRIIDAEDGKAIMTEFENIILSSYGKKSSDGKRFVKNQQLRDEFLSSEAYSTFFMELVTNTDFMIEFVNGIVPQGMAEEVAKVAAVDLKIVEEPKPEPKVVTKADIMGMSGEEVLRLSERLTSGEIVIAE